MPSKIVTPQKDCKYLKTCNLMGVVNSCTIWKQNTEKCFTFKLMKDVQELMYFKQQTENKKTFQELVEPQVLL